MDDRIGQCLGNYRLVRLLGRGGFARVYLGEHVRLGTQAAIKVLSTQMEESDRGNFLAEARTVAHLEHPHIIRILDFDVEQDTPFLVLSYAPNGSLRQRYPKGTRLPLDSIACYLKQAAAGLQYAHEAKLIHRDMKPENMLLGRQNEVLLSDFGIAVVAHSSRSQSTQEVVGTVSYMAPEQIQGKPRPASDQYGLGVIVYEWLTGHPPFRGTTAEIATQHLHASPPPLYEQHPGIPPAIENIVLKALEKDPHRRFASVQEFAVAFEQACQPFLLAASSGQPNSTARPGDMMQAPENAAFYSSLTLSENKDKSEPAKPSRRRVSRRVLLAGSLGIVGLAATCGGLIWWELAGQARPVLEAGSTLVIYTGHTSSVATVAWSPDGRHIASGSFDETVQVWDATSGAHPFIYHGHITNINAVAWSPAHTRQRIASASGNSLFPVEHDVQVWDAATGKRIVTYTGHTKPVHAAVWSPDGTRIASGGEDNTVQVWDTSNGGTLLIYSGHKALVSSLVWSPGGALIASASDDKTVQVWNVRTSALLFPPLEHTSTVNAVAWSPDGRRIASATGNIFFGGEDTVQVWNASTGEHILTYTGDTGPVSTVAWSPDSQRIASASAGPEKVVHIWDAASGASLFTYHGHTLGVNAVAWSPDGQLIASASNDGTVRVWRAP